MNNKKELHEHDAQDHTQQTSEEHHLRVEKIKKMRDAGMDPWPEVRHSTTTCKQVLDTFVEEDEKEFSVIGRIITFRLHGKAAFAHILDNGVKLQVYFKENLIGEKLFDHLQHLIDIGDIVWVKGTSFKTKRGEITVRAQDFSLQSKSLHPLPEKFHGLADVEVRYRQRYLDLISNDESRRVLQERSAIVQSCRNYLVDHNYLEVETPMLHPIAGGAAARPFVTHHNSLGHDFFLRIAPELYLKRLVVGGFDRVFEINRSFRNEGVSTRHNPEFTMLEFYTAHEDYQYGMDFVEQMLKDVVMKACGDHKISFNDHDLDFTKPFDRMSIRDAAKKYNELSEDDIAEDKIDALLKKNNVKLKKSNMTYNEKVYLLFEETVEQKLIQPTFITDFPIEVSPLAKRDAKDSKIAARAELFVAGMEVANLFNELNDPFDQANRFHHQVESHEAGDDEAHQYDADYIVALEHALPPTVGVGIGIDRLVMVLTGSRSIKDVILFPTLKKK